LPGRGLLLPRQRPSRSRGGAIQQRFGRPDYLHDIGEIDLKFPDAWNACGHHHVGHIGILGVDKNGEEWYQIEIGGNQGEVRSGRGASLGKVIGRPSRVPRSRT